jgi:magnesium transporter
VAPTVAVSVCATATAGTIRRAIEAMERGHLCMANVLSPVQTARNTPQWEQVLLLAGPNASILIAVAPPRAEECATSIVEFDFAAKTCTRASVERAPAAMAEGHFVWIDVDYTKADIAKSVVGALGLLHESVLEDAFGGEPGMQLARYPDYLHLVLSGCRIDSAGSLTLERVDVIIAEKFLITLHAGPRTFLEMVRREYEHDFLRFAKSPSFLLYEIWDNLVEHFVSTQKILEKRVHSLQHELFKQTDDKVFSDVSDIGENLLHFRSVLMPARTVLNELSTRRSVFVSEATQGFLANMVGVIERVLQDVIVDRDILAQSLNLHMSMLSHRTNRAMNKLTVLSAIFLPLTFFCGVYGMNFRYLPELEWKYGYFFFWGVVIVLGGTLLAVMRRNKLL